MSRKKHAIRKAPYAHPDFTMRLTPEKAWNAYVRGNPCISVRFFARLHGIPESTWRREPERGATGVAVKSGGRWRYPEYSAAQARADVDRGKANMGAPMRTTAPMAVRPGALIVGGRRSPYDAREILVREFPDRRIPCPGTVYNHVDAELKTATTDNGCEVSHQKALERILGRPVYYTRAYASYEKGAVENVNRIVRRWFPKGTDFSKVPREDVLAVEAIVNSIHRRSPKGETAYDYHSRLAKKV